MQLLNGEILPIDIEPKDGKEILESFGVIFYDCPDYCSRACGDCIYNEDFWKVRLPNGWKVIPPQGMMVMYDNYVELRDDQDRLRAKIVFPRRLE